MLSSEGSVETARLCLFLRVFAVEFKKVCLLFLSYMAYKNNLLISSFFAVFWPARVLIALANSEVSGGLAQTRRFVIPIFASIHKEQLKVKTHTISETSRATGHVNMSVQMGLFIHIR